MGQSTLIRLASWKSQHDKTSIDFLPICGVSILCLRSSSLLSTTCVLGFSWKTSSACFSYCHQPRVCGHVCCGRERGSLLQELNVRNSVFVKRRDPGNIPA